MEERLAECLAANRIYTIYEGGITMLRKLFNGRRKAVTLAVLAVILVSALAIGFSGVAGLKNGKASGGVVSSGVQTTYIELRNGIIKGKINGESFTAILNLKGDPTKGEAEVWAKLSNLPTDFNVLGVSGLSVLSWSNNAFAEVLGGAMNLATLTGFNYTLERTNAFPDGKAIHMIFKVTRIGPAEIAMEATWEGSYALVTDIVDIEQPIVEEVVSEAPGRVNGFYRYVLVKSDGTRIPVDTFSTYRFTPLSGTTGLLPFKQKRVTSNVWSWDPERLELHIVARSVMIPAGR